MIRGNKTGFDSAAIIGKASLSSSHFVNLRMHH